MLSVLLTAFKPYDRWTANASWLAMLELTKDFPPDLAVTTRLYPVDYEEVPRLLESDLQRNFDYALHLGQSPGSALVQLEAIGINISTRRGGKGEEGQPLVADGPAAYRSELPLAVWAAAVRQGGVPAEVSYHAGTYLCNATLYLTHHFIEKYRLRTKAAFIHLPLDVTQALGEERPLPSLPAAMSARAVRTLLEQFVAASALA